MIQSSKASGLILGLFFISTSLFAKINGKIHIAIIDTGFCNQSEIVGRPIDLTNSVKMDCKKIQEKDRRYHGHFVLKKFLENNKRNDLLITPLIVFDKNGIQKKEYWRQAIEWIKANNVDIIFTASGLKVEKGLGKLPTITIAAAGQVSGKIRRHHKLWPQSFNSKNLILVGNLIREDQKTIYADQLLLNQKRIHYYTEEESSSKAVAKALAKALFNCKSSNLKKCFDLKSKIMIDSITKTKLRTL